MRPRILVITPVAHIDGVAASLERIGEVTYLPDATPAEVCHVAPAFDAIFTNPNKSNVYLGPDVLDAATRLRVICTASTGRSHIDLPYAAVRGIVVLSLTEERDVINRISSTAELAFALTLAALRHVPRAWDSVKAGRWDYEPYIGRQMNALTVGVVGYGRLGRYYAGYARAFGSRVVAYDPYVTVDGGGVEQVERDELLRASDIISLHVHASAETAGMIDASWFRLMKPTVLLVNTARGELINEADLLAFLNAHPEAWLAADVVAGEVAAKDTSPVLAYAKTGGNVLLTPHIGGMTREGQALAYGRAVLLLQRFFEQRPVEKE